MRKLCITLVVALFGAVPLAGCGSSHSSSSATIPTRPTFGITGASSTNRGLSAKQQVAVCKRAIRAPSHLSSAARAKLEKSCETAGGGPVAQRRVVHEVCEALAEQEPQGLTRQTALAMCRNAP
jgi:hypothetical protein